MDGSSGVTSFDRSLRARSAEFLPPAGRRSSWPARERARQAYHGRHGRWRLSSTCRSEQAPSRCNSCTRPRSRSPHRTWRAGRWPSPSSLAQVRVARRRRSDSPQARWAYDRGRWHRWRSGSNTGPSLPNRPQTVADGADQSEHPGLDANRPQNGAQTYPRSHRKIRPPGQHSEESRAIWLRVLQ